MQKPRRVPRGEKRREEIAAVAQRVFLERGFTDTTMQIIASRAGASKETLYRHFGCKEDLFSEIVRARAMRVFKGMEFGLEGEPQEVLLNLGLNLLRLLMSPESLALYRLVLTETPRTPEVGRIFFEQGPAQVMRQLASYLGSATQRKLLNCPDPPLATKLFLGSVIGNRHMIALVAPDWDIVTEEKIQRHVEAAVAMFLAKYAVA
ncbi:MAG TPA: TetR/AcrR family transcriptional regulator [Methylovirgula sp.]|nr:TetR/AcrR family transcriptional regulator [Methylovirgula sp.]